MKEREKKRDKKAEKKRFLYPCTMQARTQRETLLIRLVNYISTTPFFLNYLTCPCYHNHRKVYFHFISSDILCIKTTFFNLEHKHNGEQGVTQTLVD
jgi:ribonuclease D